MSSCEAPNLLACCLQVPEIPPAVREWGQNTSLAMFAGICFMGARQYSRHARLGQ